MKNLKGACIFGQSGGPTSVINSSAAGVFIEALKQENITNVYGASHGIRGILDEKFKEYLSQNFKITNKTICGILGIGKNRIKAIESRLNNIKDRYWCLYVKRVNIIILWLQIQHITEKSWKSIMDP